MNPFHNKVVDVVIYEQIKKELRDARERIFQKYKDKLKSIKEKEEGMVGFEAFEIQKEDLKMIKEDKDLREMYNNVKNQRILTKNVVKRTFKECINEILDDVPIIDNGVAKNKRMLIVEKIVDGIMNDTLNPVTLKGFEVIRDTIGEKPVSEIINKGIQQKVIDVNITHEKVEKVKNILEGLRNARVTDGLGENIAIRTVDARPRDKGVVEVDVSGESEGVHHVDVLSDKQD